MIKLFYKYIASNLLNLIVAILKKSDKKLKSREKSWKDLLSKVKEKDSGIKRICFHAASMGEFEQAKPIIELIKRDRKDIEIIVSFFSPSGYENQKNYPYADYILYLPIDTVKKVNHFLNKVEADFFVFIRYEIWLNMLLELEKRNIPKYLICASIPGKKAKEPKLIEKMYYKAAVKHFDRVYTIGEKHTQFFSQLNSNVLTSADTRFDRIMQKVEENKNKKIIPDELLKGKKVLILGSSWKEDEYIIFPVIKDKMYEDNLLTIVTPHEPNEATLKRITSQLQRDWIYLSDIIENNYKSSSYKYIIVDSIGKLLALYAQADYAYIGGAFGAGIHSVTEAAGYGMPLSCGTGYYNSPDAINLVEINVLRAVSNREEFGEWLNYYHNSLENQKETGDKAQEYIKKSLGESQKIFEEIISYL